MRIVFFGTPNYVIPILHLVNKKLKNGNESPVAAVVTQKPKPSGRKQLLQYSDVDTWAHKRKIPIYFDVNKLMDEGIKADVGILASYGALIPPKALTYFPHGILVIHPSLLPQFRWSSPVPATIITGQNPTGATIIKMDDKFDHGPIVTQFKEDVLPTDNYETLRNRLYARSAEVLVNMLPAYMNGKIHPKPQDDSQATFARMVKKEDAYIDPKEIKNAIEGKISKTEWPIPFINDFITHYSPATIEQFIRAMYPWPVAWTLIKLSPSDKDSQRLKMLKSHLEPNTVNGKPSTENILVPDLVQLEGKTPVSWKQFREGYPNLQL